MPIPVKQIERLTKGIGLERVAERDEAVAAFLALPLAERKAAPDGVTPPPVAVVSTDGGRLQIRPEAGSANAAVAAPPEAADTADPASPGQPRRGGRFWREDKIGVLMGMNSTPSPIDPCPQIPEHFLDPSRMHRLTGELHQGIATGETAGDEATAAAEVAATAAPADPPGGAARKPPEVLHKRVVATRLRWPSFGPVVAAAAWALGLYGSARRAFVADGAEVNWTIGREHFSSFEPIADFIHVLSYVYAAAHAGCPKVTGWYRDRDWIGRVGAGKIDAVLEAVRARAAELGEPSETDKATEPRRVVAEAMRYLENNKGRMQYDRYRREGLPRVSSYVESAVKQINKRVKGTEKFGTADGAEGMLQLRADRVSRDGSLEAFWTRRKAATTGQRPYRKIAA